jgi:hypothetical protein
MIKVSNLEYSPGKTFSEVLVSPEVSDILVDYSEIALDSLISGGVLEEIPILKTISSGIKIWNKVQDAYLAKKLYKFLFQIKDISEEERRKTLESITEDQGYGEKVSETLLVMLDKFNHVAKAEIVGQLFKAVLKGKIDYNTFLRLGYIIEQCFVGDLIALAKVWNGSYLERDISSQFTMLNIISYDFVADYAYGTGKISERPKLELTDLGKILMQYGLKKYCN